LIAALFAAPGCLGGCKEAVEDKPAPKVLSADDQTVPEAIGVYPSEFKCETVAPLPAVIDAVGQTVTLRAQQFEPQFGTPGACEYHGEEVKPAEGIDAGPYPSWSFDIDCRTLGLQSGERLMATYAADETSVPIRVGKSGIDHRDTVLLFIDDDSPCSVRVLGRDREIRTALAELVAKNLTATNAPSKVIPK
jgi:hypothetical protein